MITPKPKTVFELFDGHPERWIKNSHVKFSDGTIDNLSPRNHEEKLKLKEPIAFCISGAEIFIYGKLPHSLCEWNDAPERTFEEVLAKVKELGI